MNQLVLTINRNSEPPEEGPSDVAHGVVKAALGSIPLIGAAAAEVFQMVIMPPVARRQREWMEDIAAALRQLESERGVPLSSLPNNPAFVDAMLAASAAAIKTSQHEKRRVLRNAILNSALPNAPDLAMQQMFIAQIDSFTDWHLLLLKLFQEPAKWVGPNGETVQPDSSLAGVIKQAFPSLAADRALCDQVWDELNAAGFTSTPGIRTMMTGPGTMSSRTTDYGNRFLAFVESPIDEARHGELR